MEGDYTEEPRISHLCDSIEELGISPLNFKNAIPSHSNYYIMSTGQQFELIALNQALFSYLIVLFFIKKNQRK